MRAWIKLAAIRVGCAGIAVVRRDSRIRAAHAGDRELRIVEQVLDEERGSATLPGPRAPPQVVNDL